MVYSRLVDVSSRLVDVPPVWRMCPPVWRMCPPVWRMCPPAWWMCPPVWRMCLPAGGCASRLVDVPPGWWCQRRQHIAAGHPCGQARQLLSAAGSLAPESKLQGEIDRCDYSYYQLFRCSFWVCFYIAVYRLKY